MKHMDYCSRCKAKSVPLIKHAKNKEKTVQYYYCRKCQNTHTKRWGNTHSGKEWLKRRNARDYIKYKLHHDAREAVNNAVASGKMIKPTLCSVCFSKGRIEGHHYDYYKPLEVIWLCTGCHGDIHKVKS